MASFLKKILLIGFSVTLVFCGNEILLKMASLLFNGFDNWGGVSYLGIYLFFIIIHFAIIYGLLGKELIDNFHQQLILLTNSVNHNIVSNTKDLYWNTGLLFLLLLLVSSFFLQAWFLSKVSFSMMVAFFLLLSFLFPVSQIIFYVKNKKIGLREEIHIHSNYYNLNYIKLSYFSFLLLLSWSTFFWQQFVQKNVARSTYQLSTYDEISGCLATRLWARNEGECQEKVNLSYDNRYTTKDIYFYLYGDCEFNHKSIRLKEKDWVLTKCLEESCKIMFFRRSKREKVNLNLLLPFNGNRCEFRVKTKVGN